MGVAWKGKDQQEDRTQGYSGSHAWKPCNELVLLHVLSGNALCLLVSLTKIIQLFEQLPSPSTDGQVLGHLNKSSKQAHPSSVSFYIFILSTSLPSRWVGIESNGRNFISLLRVSHDKPEREATSKRVPAATLRWPLYTWVGSSQGFLSMGEVSTHRDTCGLV